MDIANLIANSQPKLSPKAGLVANNVADKTMGKSNEGGKQGQSFGAAFEQAVNTIADDKESVVNDENNLLPIMQGNNQSVILLQLQSEPQLSQMITVDEGIAAVDVASLVKPSVSSTNENGVVASSGKLTAINTLNSQVGAPVNNNAFAELLLKNQDNVIKSTIATKPETLSTAISDGLFSKLGSDNATMTSVNQVASTNLSKNDTVLVSPQLAINIPDNPLAQQIETKASTNNFSSSDGQNLANQLLNQELTQGNDGKAVQQDKSMFQVSKSMSQLSGAGDSVSSSQVSSVGEVSLTPQDNNTTNAQQPHFITNIVDMRPNATNVLSTTPNNGEVVTTQNYQVPDQIIEQAKLIKTTEDTQMVIKLKPEHLGELALKVSVENGVVSASFHSDNAQVRAIIETSLVQLKQELAAQGIKVDSVGVYSGMGDLLSNGQNQAGREQQNPRYKNRKIDLSDFADEVDKIAPVATNTANDTGVDYRI